MSNRKRTPHSPYYVAGRLLGQLLILLGFLTLAGLVWVFLVFMAWSLGMI